MKLNRINKIVSSFLLIGDKFMPELHLRQLEFTYRACGQFTKLWERIQKFKETGNLKHKTCLALAAAFSDGKDLDKRTISDKYLKDRAYEITINPKFDGYQRALASMAYKFSLQENSKKFKRRKVYFRFKDNIWVADLDGTIIF